MAKLLDYDGLQYLYNKMLTKFPEGTDFSEEFKIERDNTDDITLVSLNLDEELDENSLRPVENKTIKKSIDSLRDDIEKQVDTTNTFFYILCHGIMPYTGSGSVTNNYECNCYCVKNGAVVTIYFDIEGNYGAQVLPLANFNNDAIPVPSAARPFVDVNNLVAQSESGFNNISVDSESGQIFITSENGVFNVHCAITYIVVSDSVASNPDLDPEKEARIYNVKARMVKIGDYYPTYANGKMSGYNVLGAALTTDVSGSQFSGYEGNYTVYLTNARSTYAGTEQFYWSKKFEDIVDSSGNGSLFTFDQCFEAATTVNDTTLREHGYAAVEALVETNEDTIQYFVTAFGKHAWIGGVDSPYNAQIKEKAYGATTGAGDYNGRFYWTDCILAHVFRFVPASIEDGTTVIIADKTHPIEVNGTVVGFVDKVVPLKLIEKAYSWANFSSVNGSTWRGVKLYCPDMGDVPSTEALNAKFSGHLVISDWNKPSNSGNLFSGDTYYQRIDSKLNEVEETSGSGVALTKPAWMQGLPSYDTLMSSLIAQDYSGTQLYNGYVDIALKDENGGMYVARFQPEQIAITQYSETGQPVLFDPDIFYMGVSYELDRGIGIDTDVPEYDYEDINYVAGVLLRYNGSYWEKSPYNNEAGGVDQDITYLVINDERVEMTEATVIEATGGITFDFSAFDYGHALDWTIQPATGGGLVTITSIEQSPVQVRTNSSWSKPGYKLDSYTGDEFN